MQTPEPTIIPDTGEPVENTARLNWASWLQFILSTLAVLTLFGFSVILIAVSFIQIIARSSDLQIPLTFFLLSAGMILSGVLLLPSAWLSLAQLSGWSTPDFQPFLAKIFKPLNIVLAFPVIMIAGYFASGKMFASLVFLPFLQILAIGLPILFFLLLATRKLIQSPAQRLWGEFGAGLGLSPTIIFIAEAVALLGGVLFLAINPQFIQLIVQVGDQIRNGVDDPEQILNSLRPFVTNPFVIFALLSYGAVLVPLIEELIKPLGVWFLAGKDITPRQGFVYGALCGAGYALFESLAVSSNGQDWAFIILARAGTGVIHITTTALSGWALASAWEKNKYLQLGITYLTVVTIHGLWNGLTISAGINAIPNIQEVSRLNAVVGRIGVGAPLGLVVLLVGCLWLLVLANRILRHDLEDAPTGEATII